jgi:hypothetical protein
MPGGPNPSISNIGNSLTAQAILFVAKLVPNLKGQTNAFFEMVEKMPFALGNGTNGRQFEYSTLPGNTNSTTDGQIGSPIFVPQNQSSFSLSEWSDYTNHSRFVVAAAIDDQVGNSSTEMSYRAGQSLSELYSTFFDGLSAVDSAVNASSLLTTPYLFTLITARTMKEELVSISVMPKREGEYVGAISSNVVNDILNGSGLNASLIDWAKYTKDRADAFEKIAAGDQLTPIRLQTTGCCFYQTPFVTKTADYQSAGLGSAFRTYLAGQEAARGYWLPVPGDTDMDSGDWRDIECFVTKDAARSAFDPTGTIGAWSGYIFHQTITGPPVVGIDTQRVRYCDSIPAIQ